MYHHGERTVQLRAGLGRDGWGSAGVGATIPPVAAEFLGRQRLAVLAAADDDGAAWAGVLTGSPGFLTAAGDRTVIADRLPADGDPLAGRFGTERDLGMVLIEPAGRKRMRVNGRARADGGQLVVHTEQVYANCPKYIQTRAHIEDRPAQRRVATTGRALTAQQQRWIAAADTFFIGTYAPGLGADASHRGGNPGFVTATDRRVTWPDYGGNNMYMTLGNLDLEPRCGLLFLDWENGDTLQVTGRAGTDWDPARAAATPGAKRLVDFEVDQVVQIAGGLGQRWSFGDYSRFNPA